MQGISQVSIAISQTDRVTQNNIGLVEESSTAPHSLSAQAPDLRGVVEASGYDESWRNCESECFRRIL
jgi:methyl-accepting chemotaxis protein